MPLTNFYDIKFNDGNLSAVKIANRRRAVISHFSSQVKSCFAPEDRMLLDVDVISINPRDVCGLVDPI